MMYFLFQALTGLIGPINLIPHFSKGAKGTIGVSGQWFLKDGAAQTTKCSRHTVRSPSKSDEGSENGAIEDPLCSSVEIPLCLHGQGHADVPCLHRWLDASTRIDIAIYADAPCPHGRILKPMRT